MKVKLLRNASIIHKSGEIVDVSPEVAAFLVSVRSAVAAPPVKEAKKAAEKKGKK